MTNYKIWGLAEAPDTRCCVWGSQRPYNRFFVPEGYLYCRRQKWAFYPPSRASESVLAITVVWAMSFQAEIYGWGHPKVKPPSKKYTPCRIVSYPDISIYDIRLMYRQTWHSFIVPVFLLFLPICHSFDSIFDSIGSHSLPQLATACHVGTGSTQDRTGHSILPRCRIGNARPHRIAQAYLRCCASFHPSILPSILPIIVLFYSFSIYWILPIFIIYIVIVYILIILYAVRIIRQFGAFWSFFMSHVKRLYCALSICTRLLHFFLAMGNPQEYSTDVDGKPIAQAAQATALWQLNSKLWIGTDKRNSAVTMLWQDI